VIGRRVGAAALVGHGLLHLPGVALLWWLGQPVALGYADVGPRPGAGAGIAIGGLCIAAAGLFVLAGVSLLTGRAWWHRVMLAAVAVSCAALLPSASTAAAALVIDWVALVVAIMVGARAAQPGRGHSSDQGLGAGLR